MRWRSFYRTFCFIAVCQVFGGLIPLAVDQNSGSSWAAEFLSHDRVILIESGDTLSQALVKKYPDRHLRIWGKKGILAKIQSLNPEVSDLNYLLPRQTLVLGDLEKDLAQFSRPEPNRIVAEVVSVATAEDAPAEAPVAEPAKPEVAPMPISTPTTTPAVAPTVPIAPVAVVVPPVAPPAPVAVISSPAPIRYGWIDVVPNFSYSLIKATDRSTGIQASLPSNLNPGALVNWGQHWSESFETKLELGLREETYTGQSGTGVNLSNGSHLLTQFGILGRITPSGKSSEGGFSILSGLEFSQSLFIRGVDATTDTLDAVMVPVLSAGLSYQLTDLDPFMLSFFGLGRLYLPASTGQGYSIQTGEGFSAGAQLSEQISEKTSIFGGVFLLELQPKFDLRQSKPHRYGHQFGHEFSF